MRIRQRPSLWQYELPIHTALSSRDRTPSKPTSQTASAHTALIAGGNILVTGGLYCGALTGSHKGSCSVITAADGTVGSSAWPHPY